MHNNMDEWRRQLDKALRQRYYNPICDFCHNEIIMSYDEAEIVLFEPKEVEYEHYEVERNEQGEVKSMKPVMAKEVRSSDPEKDIFKFKCPYCGHIIVLTRKEAQERMCSYYGDNNIRFTLDEVETERARKFIEKHDHIDEFIEQGKLAFSTMGQQFTYEIIPGGLGNSIIIKCNQCGESEEITNTENW